MDGEIRGVGWRFRFQGLQQLLDGPRGQRQMASGRGVLFSIAVVVQGLGIHPIVLLFFSPSICLHLICQASILRPPPATLVRNGRKYSKVSRFRPAQRLSTTAGMAVLLFTR